MSLLSLQGERQTLRREAIQLKAKRREMILKGVTAVVVAGKERSSSRRDPCFEMGRAKELLMKLESKAISLDYPLTTIKGSHGEAPLPNKNASVVPIASSSIMKAVPPKNSRKYVTQLLMKQRKIKVSSLQS